MSIFLGKALSGDKHYGIAWSIKTNKNQKKFSGELQWKIMVKSKQVAQPCIHINCHIFIIILVAFVYY